MSTITEKKLFVYDGQEPFHLIEASKLKVTDDFMKYDDVFGKVKKIRDLLINILNNTNVHDFYIQGIDPSMNEDGTGIQYVAGKMPAVGHSTNWARKAALDYAPHMDSRLGTDIEYILFCGFLIKELVENGFSVNEAWHEVCSDSAKIGNYFTGKGRRSMLPTGSIKVAGFADLANTTKLLYSNNKIFIASGAYCHKSYYGFVADISRVYDANRKDVTSVPWVVIPV